MYKKGAGNDKQGKDAGNRTLCPYRNFGQAIKIADHPTNIQGLIRIYHSLISLKGLIRFQRIWNKVSKTFGMISKREFRKQCKEENERTKVRKLFEAVPKLEKPCGDLKGLIETVSGLYNCTGLNITHSSMSHRTAKAVYENLSGGFIFIQEYFLYIEHNHFCKK